LERTPCPGGKRCEIQRPLFILTKKGVRLNEGGVIFMKHCKIIALFTGILLVAFSVAFADENNPQVNQSEKAVMSAVPQGSYDKQVTMEEVVVTATRTDREMKDVPVSVTVVTAEDIKANNILNLDEALKYAAGVWNRRMRGIADVGASVNIRGIYGNERNLVLLDNQPINSTVWGGVPWSGLNIDQVERIEVVKGPFSALYGINAMGGVINIITKTPQKRTFSAEAGYGEDNTTVFRLNYGDKLFDKLSINAGIERKHTDGYPTYIVAKGASEGEQQPDDIVINPPKRTTDITGKQTRYIIGNTGDNETTDWNVFIKGSYEFSKGHSLSLHYTHSEQEDEWDDFNSYLHNADGSDITNGTVFFDGKRISIKEADFIGWIFGGRDNDIVVANYVNEISDRLTIKADAGLTYQYRYYTIPDVWWPANATRDGGDGTFYDYPSTVLNSTLQADISLRNNLMATVGLAFRWDNGEQNVWPLSDWRDEDSTKSKTTHIEGDNYYYSAFAQTEWKPVQQVTVIPALRFDYWETKGETAISGTPKQDFDTRDDSMLSPKLSVGYEPLKDTRLRASAGMGFKPPDIDKLYRVLPGGGPDDIPTLPNRDLDPETVYSWEVGLDQIFFDKKVRLSATYFENYIKDALFQKIDADGKQRWYSGAESEIKGVEAELIVRPLTWISFFGNLTYQDSEMTKNDQAPAQEGNELTYVPELSWNVGADVTYKKAQLRIYANHVDKAYSRSDNTDKAENVPLANDEYTLVNASLGLDVTKEIKFTFSVDNIFNEEYYLYWKASERKWLLTMTYTM